MKTIKHVSTDRHEEWGGPKRYLRVVVYEEMAELRDDAAKMVGVNWGNSDYPNDAVAVYHPPILRLSVNSRGKFVNVTDPHYGGLIRLHWGHLTYEVVAHECVHAAAAIWRMDVTSRKDGSLGPVNLGSDCGWREEGFAYLVGDLTGAIVRELSIHNTKTIIY